MLVKRSELATTDVDHARETPPSKTVLVVDDEPPLVDRTAGCLIRPESGIEFHAPQASLAGEVAEHRPAGSLTLGERNGIAMQFLLAIFGRFAACLIGRFVGLRFEPNLLFAPFGS